MHPPQHMQLTFNNDCINACVILDDRGRTLYRVSTNGSRPPELITRVNGPDDNTEVLGAIDWGRNTILFKGNEVDADQLLRKRWYSKYAGFLMEWTNH